mgnify:CR=1 FL=1
MKPQITAWQAMGWMAAEPLQRSCGMKPQITRVPQAEIDIGDAASKELRHEAADHRRAQ